MQSFGCSKQHQKQFESDNYCWTCHRGEPELPCTTCGRSFHLTTSCSQVKSLSEEEMLAWRCPDCIDIEAGAARIKAQQTYAACLKQVLKFNFQQLIGHKKGFTKPFMSIKYQNVKGNVLNAMDLNKVKRKIEIDAYSCCEEFWSDVKWILHNTVVYYSLVNKTKKAFDLLSDYVEEEVYTLRLCYDCYASLSKDWIVTPCSKPHILVWAKQRTYPYWPAKVMSYNSDEDTVDVRYFGDGHMRAILPASNCLLYSEQSPATISGIFQNSFNAAKMEANRYIENLIGKYGLFNYSQPGTVFQGKNLERYLYDQIPNVST